MTLSFIGLLTPAVNAQRLLAWMLWTQPSVQSLNTTRSNPINGRAAACLRDESGSLSEIFPLCCAAHMARCSRLRSACKNARSTVHVCHPAAFAYKGSPYIYRWGFTREWTSKPCAGERKRTDCLFDMKNCNFHWGLLHLGAQKPLDSTRCESLVLVTYVNSLRSPKAFVNTGSVFPEQFRFFFFGSTKQERRLVS